MDGVARALYTDLRGLLMSAMEVLWDLLIFLVLVAAGLVVLRLLARSR
jgi:hypothetical protein